MARDSYFVKFTGYIDELRRPENFPHEVHVTEVYNEVESLQHLQFLVNDRFIKLATSAGLVVLKNEDEPSEEGKLTFDKRIFIPWHMITYMTMDVKYMPAKYQPQESIIPSTVAPEEKKDLVN